MGPYCNRKTCIWRSIQNDFLFHPGKLRLVFEGENGESFSKDVFDFKSKGCALGCTI